MDNFSHLAAYTALLGALIFSHDAQCKSRWNISNLQKTQIYHDGPNCINATLASQGILNHIAYIDSIEMKYFLENYCRVTQTSSRGDILVVLRENSIEHTAVRINSKLVFEKENTSGLFGIYKDESGSAFKVKLESNSEYLSSAQDVRSIATYICASPQNIQSDLERMCSSIQILPIINRIRSQFEEMSLSSKLILEKEQVPVSDVQKLQEILSQLNGSEECATYALAIGISTYGHLFHVTNEQKNLGPIKTLNNRLFAVLLSLKRKIESAQPTQKVKPILDEMRWTN